MHIGAMPRPSKKTVAAARLALARSLAERDQTHSPRRVRLQILGMLDAHNDGVIWTVWLMGSLAAVVLKQIDTLVAVNGAFVAFGVWRFGATYRERVDRELQPLSSITGLNVDDTAEVEAAIQELYRGAEKMAARIIILGTIIGACAPLAWRLMGIAA